MIDRRPISEMDESEEDEFEDEESRDEIADHENHVIDSQEDRTI